MDLMRHWSYTGLDINGSLSGRCQMVGCKIGSHILKKWRSTLCEKHPPYHHDVGLCTCRPPYVLYSFPKDPVKKNIWIARVNRKGFTPNQESKICSRHFVGEEVNETNFYPTECLGYKPHRRLTGGRKPPKNRSVPSVPISKPAQEFPSQCENLNEESKLKYNIWIHYIYIYVGKQLKPS